MKIENKLIGTYVAIAIIGLIAFIWVFNTVNHRFDQFDERMETSKKQFHSRFKERFDEINKRFDQASKKHHATLMNMEKELKAKRASMKQEFEEKSSDFLKEHQAFTEDFDRRFLKGRTLHKTSQDTNQTEHTKGSTHDEKSDVK